MHLVFKTSIISNINGPSISKFLLFKIKSRCPIIGSVFSTLSQNTRKLYKEEKVFTRTNQTVSANFTDGDYSIIKLAALGSDAVAFSKMHLVHGVNRLDLVELHAMDLIKPYLECFKRMKMAEDFKIIKGPDYAFDANFITSQCTSQS